MPQRAASTMQNSAGRALLALCVAVAAPAFPAFAGGQRAPDVPGSRTPAQLDPMAPDQVRATNLAMAKCIYSRRPDEATRYLEMSDAIEADHAALGYAKADLDKRLDLGRCLGEVATDKFDFIRLSFAHPMLRAHLAAASYLARHPTPLTKAGDWQERVEGRTIVAANSASLARSRGDFADCLTFHDAAGADALLRTPVASTAERAAAKALVPALSQCLVAGSDFKLTPATIREFAAAGLWARSHYTATRVAASPAPAKN